MTPNKIPHLCGGTLFDLLLQARKQRRKARNKLKGGSDGLSETDTYAGLIYVVTGDDLAGSAGGTLGKSASNFKKCTRDSGTYTPFTNPTTQSVFNSAMKRKDPALLERITGFIDRFLNIDSCEWLVRALIEILQGEADDDKEFAVDYGSYMKVKDLNTVILTWGSANDNIRMHF